MTVRILIGDCIERLRELPGESVHCCVTSPPYAGLRDYGEDGQIGLEAVQDCLGWATGETCGECYVCRMVAVFREVRRVLRDDGTLWLNLGDSYNGSGGAGGDYGKGGIKEGQPKYPGRRLASLKPKDLCMIPARVALALQADGWYLRQDIIWHKPNPMPESVRDRCTKAHEYVFLLSKSGRYFWDQEAVKEPVAGTAHARGNGVNPKAKANAAGCKQNESFSAAVSGLVDVRNVRSVWTIGTKPFSEAHFATFPPELPERCIKAGCPEDGTVLDPFFGAGTTGLVADRLGRDCIGIELNPEYAEIARKRIKGDAPLFADVS